MKNITVAVAGIFATALTLSAVRGYTALTIPTNNMDYLAGLANTDGQSGAFDVDEGKEWEVDTVSPTVGEDNEEDDWEGAESPAEDEDDELGDIGIDLSIPQELHITRPAENLETSLSSYFIMGTSDPDEELLFDDEEVERLGTLGTWGVLVDLKTGRNTFTVTQGDEEETIVITRKTPSAVPISGILQDSMFPTYVGGVKVGHSLPVECIAPAGAKVTATFNDKTVVLKQVAQATPGIAAKFTGMLPVEGGYEEDFTENWGPITYTLTVKEKSSSYESNGDVYVAGENSEIALRVADYVGFVYPDLNDPSSFKSKLKRGAADYMVAQSNSHFGLRSGGYVPSDMVEIIEGEVAIDRTLDGISFVSDERSERLVFAGAGGALYATVLDRGTFSLLLYNTEGDSLPDLAESRLFSGAVWEEPDEGGMELVLTRREDSLVWGYDVSYDENSEDLVLTFKYKPEIDADSETPFSGITIVLDPGHGGTDGGAQGVAGALGPDENMINLAHAYVIRDHLESLGAEVVLSRGRDTNFSLNQRLESIEEHDADFFLSIHHNSVAESSDGNRAKGIEVYYHDELSEYLAEFMLEALSGSLERDKRFTEQSYYRVTMMPYAPAILMELGFMCNPNEYEKLTNPDQMQKAAEAVAQGLLQVLA